MSCVYAGSTGSDAATTLNMLGEVQDPDGFFHTEYPIFVPNTTLEKFEQNLYFTDL